jgi:hypothetical protein
VGPEGEDSSGASKRLRRHAYAAAFADVRAVVNDLDPIGLLGMGAPEDEYDPEVRNLVRLVLRAEPFEEDDVDAVWRRWFGDDYSMAGTAALAAQTEALRTLQRRFVNQ